MAIHSHQETLVPRSYHNIVYEQIFSSGDSELAQIRTINQFAKRIFDFTIALIMLVILSPLLLSVAITVALDGGPAVFRHRRIGFNNQSFECLKFRSMSVNAEQNLSSYLATNPLAALEWTTQRKLTHDPRVTRLGKFLRKTSLDELPQLFNVLRGEMSLIGPRPVVKEELDHNYCSDGRRAYTSTRPGVTGLWQISGRSSTSYNERVLLDIAYVKNWSLSRDLGILLRTIPAVLMRRGAV